MIIRIFKKIKIIIFLFLILMVVDARANINSDLDNYFNNLGFSHNVTEPTAYHGQQAGFYTGGSVFARDNVRNVQIAQIDLPSYRAGCGGIDLYMGGFSFIDKSNFVDMLKNILNNAGGYTFNLALETVTPQLANTLKYIQDVANKVNQTNINSCETAASLVGGMWPKTEVSQREVCAAVGTSKNVFSDWAEARQGCGHDGEIGQVMDEAAHDNKYRDLVTGGNLAWKAIQRNDFLNHDPELAQLFMSITGTIIITHHDNERDKWEGKDTSPQINIWPALIAPGKNDLINALLKGGQVQIYQCDEEINCIAPKQQTVTISSDSALLNHIKALLSDIKNKIFTDTPITPEEIGFLQATKLPIYKILNVNAAYAKNGDFIDLSYYADVIAIDILNQYLDETLNLVATSAQVLQYPQIYMDQFIKNIDIAHNSIRAQKVDTYKETAISMNLIESSQTIERMLAGELSTSLANNLSWARGMRS